MIRPEGQSDQKCLSELKRFVIDDDDLYWWTCVSA